MNEPDAFYFPGGNAYRSSEWTRGPWSDGHQHGGPPAALLARAIEQRASEFGNFQIARLTVELLAPIPIAVMSIAVGTVRSGKRALTLSGSLYANGREVCRAIGLCIRLESLDLPSLMAPEAPPPLPETGQSFEFPFFSNPIAYHKAVDVRVVCGVFGRGPITAWIAMRCALVAGEIPSALQRVVVAADSGNGLSAVLDTRDYTFLNPDLTVHLYRLPRTRWVGMAAVTVPQPNGIGLAESALFDETGRIGRSLQSLVIKGRRNSAPRP